jgi:hypothetical protein
MKNKIRIMSAIVSLTVALTTISFGANATDIPNENIITSNCTDTPWSVNNEYVRYKSDNTGVYVYNSSTQYAAKVSLYGENYQSPTQYSYYNAGYNTINLILYPNTERLIHNTLGYPSHQYAHICFSPYGTGYNGASGLWSPDSVGSYPYLN